MHGYFNPTMIGYFYATLGGQFRPTLTLIYDRFALYAIREIIKNKTKLKISEPSFDNILNDYKIYKEFFYDIFESEIKEGNKEEYINSVRMIDQALWAYGHCLFISRTASGCP